ncbi:MAG: hypothetical protein A2W05_00315 [Candidatus Schekmanbacteria bacterium RBG_16_38_10]|uniref:Delta-aminolevulinic acid dehydratase n=1 Tax=Candidatus Schekmanbacteria bacterium RBG_16_38_10 TaxID=1817879 RepID=A0A1F7RR05_9BACT|nr:MAG: hypothetical protein A2W05_00315 [Candidatus Schekmanbacteria bacterium RBG_16_38_10]
MKLHDDTLKAVKKSALDLFEYCRLNNWAGFDPYDGLNSPIFDWLPFLQNRFTRLVFIQFMKRSKINIRAIMGISKGQNPKGLALFSSSVLKLLDIGLIKDSDIAISVINQLIHKKTPNQPYICWGYNFDWQQRKLLVPKYTPNIICTTFAGNALLDAYEKFDDSFYLDMALSAGNFIIKGLNISKSTKGICFSYTPLDRAQVHNANLLGAAFLARLFSISNQKEFLDYALLSARFSVNSQSSDGSWPYGENEVQKWIDNFHTGYNLVALHRFSHYTGNGEFEENIKKGFQFYKSHFFTDGCLAKYYHNRLYPIDIHAIAQSIVTLIELKEMDQDNIDLALSVCQWAIDNMKSNEGYFYFQKKRFYMNRISYMRWSQAWMLLALSTLLGYCEQATTTGHRDACVVRQNGLHEARR